MTTETDWRTQVGRSWAQNYALTDRSFAGLTQVLLDRAAPLVGKRVLDIGCGAGELSLALARQNPDAQILGIDISHDLIEVAQTRAADLANARFIEADAGAWRDPAFAADLVVSRHGVMFFADPVAAFANIRAGTGAGARLLPGVAVCDGAVIGAGAVVTQDITEAGTWAGVPARRIS